jgi:antitoxin component YwqK of YwqJK toxin-antitoxin module
MKQLLGFSLLVFFLSCSGSNDETTESGDSVMSEHSAQESCDCKEIDTDSTGLHTKKGELYTGACVSYYEGTTNKYIEKNIFSGKLHGKVAYFDKGGELLFEEVYENGELKKNLADAGSQVCECTELEIKTVQGMSVYLLGEEPFTGKCEKYYDGTKQLYMESNYKDGLLEGYTTYFNKDGSTILMEKYERGELSSAIH